MILSIRNYASSAYESLPTIRMEKPANMLRKAERLALPIIAFVGMQQMQEANALGTLGCVLCLAAGGTFACIPICALAIATAPVPIF